MKLCKLTFIVLLMALAGVVMEARTIRVLGIGNSFSVDAIEQNLHELGMAGGDTIIVGNLYIGGCSLKRHVENCRGDSALYLYTKILADGQKVQQPNTRISYALGDEPWDYISVQQASPNSGQYATYMESLPELLEYVKARKPEGAEIVLHQTWAYQGESKHPNFVNYDRDQMKMYEAIIDASRRAADACDIRMIIPCGTAIQNARTSEVGDHLDRDGYHLSYDLGRYTAACVWYEKLTGRSVVGNSYAPAGLSAERVAIAQKAAHNAVASPFDVTPF